MSQASYLAFVDMGQGSAFTCLKGDVGGRSVAVGEYQNLV